MKLINWLNGKKTTIGAAFLMAAVFVSEVIIGKWHVDNTWIVPLAETFQWVGMAFSGVGLAHKGMK